MDEADRRAALELGWLERIAGGDRVAFDELFRAYEQRLYRYFARLVGDPAAAEELTVDVMFEVWRGAKRFRRGSKPSTWIFGIAHHKAVDARRRRRPPAMELDAATPLADRGPGPEERVEARRAAGGVRVALAALSPAHREVVELTFFHGFSYPEIAAALGCPVNTVKTRMFYAKQALAPLLARAGLGRTEP